MATLIDYAREQFPTHHVEASAPDTELTAHTVVAQVLGSHRMKSLEQRAKEALAGATIVTALVRPVHEGVVPTGAGDSEAVLDLPRSRIAALAAMVAVLTLLILQASFLVPPFGYAVLMARTTLRSTTEAPARAASAPSE